MLGDILLINDMHKAAAAGICDFVKKDRGIEVFDHWVVFNMPANTIGISEGGDSPGRVGLNSRGSNDYVK